MTRTSKGGHYGALTQRAAQDFLNLIDGNLHIDQRPRGTKTYDIFSSGAEAIDGSRLHYLGQGSTPREALVAAGFDIQAGAFDLQTAVRAHLAFCLEYGRPVVESKAAWYARIQASIGASEEAARGRVDTTPWVAPPPVETGQVFNCAKCGNVAPVTAGGSSVYCADCLAISDGEQHPQGCACSLCAGVVFGLDARDLTDDDVPQRLTYGPFTCDHVERHTTETFIPCQDCQRAPLARKAKTTRTQAIERALQVIALDAGIWLAEHDPQALIAECGVCGRNKRVCCDSGYTDNEDGTRTHVGAVCVDCHADFHASRVRPYDGPFDQA